VTSSRLDPVRHRIRRLKTLPVFPTLLTGGDLACGITAVLCAAHASGPSHSQWLFAGACFVFAAMVCDMLDGKVARLTNTAGPFGAELDSLADVVSFGVAPAILVHRLILGEPYVFGYGGRFLWFLTVFYPVLAAIRLARYNVEHSDAATPYFRGLPSPGAAALICSWIIVHHTFHAELVSWNLLRPDGYTSLDTLPIFGWAMIVVTGIAALLMVSTLRYPHVGNTLLGRMGFRSMILMIGVLGLLWFEPWLTLFFATTGYVLYGLVLGAWQTYRTWRRGGSLLEDEDEAGAEDAGLGTDRHVHEGPAHGR